MKIKLLVRLLYVDIFLYSISYKASAIENSYLLEPVNATLHVSVKKSDVPDLEVAKFGVDFDLEQLELVLNDQQFRDALHVLGFVSSYFKKAAYRREWSEAVQLKDVSHQRKLWHYAMSAVLKDVRRVREQYRWESIKAFGKMRRAFIALRTIELAHGGYISCFISQLSFTHLYSNFFFYTFSLSYECSGVLGRKAARESPEWIETETKHKITMNALVEALSFETIVMLRAVTLMLFKRSGGMARLEKRRKEVERKKKAAEQKQKSSWFGGWFGGGSESEATDEDKEQSSAEAGAPALTDSDWSEFYDAIGYQATSTSQNTLAVAPPEYVFARLHGQVRHAGVRLERVGASTSRKREPLAMLNLQSFKLGVLQRPTSIDVVGSLARVVVTDCATEQPQFPQVVDLLQRTEHAKSLPSSTAE